MSTPNIPARPLTLYMQATEERISVALSRVQHNSQSFFGHLSNTPINSRFPIGAYELHSAFFLALTQLGSVKNAAIWSTPHATE